MLEVATADLRKVLKVLKDFVPRGKASAEHARWGASDYLYRRDRAVLLDAPPGKGVLKVAVVQRDGAMQCVVQGAVPAQGTALGLGVDLGWLDKAIRQDQVVRGRTWLEEDGEQLRVRAGAGAWQVAEPELTVAASDLVAGVVDNAPQLLWFGEAAEFGGALDYVLRVCSPGLGGDQVQLVGQELVGADGYQLHVARVLEAAVAQANLPGMGARAIARVLRAAPDREVCLAALGGGEWYWCGVGQLGPWWDWTVEVSVGEVLAIPYRKILEAFPEGGSVLALPADELAALVVAARPGCVREVREHLGRKLIAWPVPLELDGTVPGLLRVAAGDHEVVRPVSHARTGAQGRTWVDPERLSAAVAGIAGAVSLQMHSKMLRVESTRTVAVLMPIVR